MTGRMCGMSRYETPAAPKERPCVVYSFGVRYETSFEESILQKTNCELHGVDFSVSNFSAQLLALPEEQKRRAHFLQAGVAPGESNTPRHPPFYSIKVCVEGQIDYVGRGKEEKVLTYVVYRI
jgi:hypothetical protein